MFTQAEHVELSSFITLSPCTIRLFKSQFLAVPLIPIVPVALVTATPCVAGV